MNKKPIIAFGFSIILLFFGLCVPTSFEDVFAAPSSQQDAVYIIQEGDTLGSITLQFGISLDDLLSVNEISDPNAVNIGQRLIIPGLEGMSGVLKSQVLPFGSSLTGLFRQYDLEKNDFVKLNRMTSPSETIAGVKFIVPINEQFDPLTPISNLPDDFTLLETAILADTTPWKLITNNHLSANWDVMPGEIFYGNAISEDSVTIFNGVESIIFNELPFTQGETVQVEIITTSPADFSGQFNNQDITFISENNQNYYGFLGIHALLEPGPYPFQITAFNSDGSNQTFEQLILVGAGAYGDEWVNVPEEYLNENDILNEDAYILPILSQVTPEKLWEGTFKYPVDEPLVNSSFGQRRNYNNGGLFFYHTGMDFAVNAPNLNVYATADGKVALAEALTIKGNALLIDHGYGVFSGYWHLSEFNVSVGDNVNQGDIIAQIGNTGRSAGPHLHFEIDVAGIPVNPQTWLIQEFPIQSP